MSIEERVKTIESQFVRVRWFNRCLIVCTILSLGVRFISKNFSGAKEIRASRFIVEDEEGYSRAVLKADGWGPVLVMKGRNGRPGVMLGLFNDGPMLSMDDWKQTTRVYPGSVRQEAEFEHI